MQKSFGELELERRIEPDGVLSKVDRLIDWERLRGHFSGLYKRDETGAGGQEPFDALLMFKAILLGQWHSLSDAELERALYVRLDFMRFCGLLLSDAVPDETTLCRFRNRLIKHQRLEGLLAQINAQLQGHGLMVKGASAAIVDATLIESAARPNKTITVETDSTGQTIQFEDGSQPGVSCAEQDSADHDATWVKKGRKSYFGYRSYVVVEGADGYVCGVHTAPANQNEVKHFATALESTTMAPTRVYADKGSASSANRQWLRQRKIKSAIMHKAHKNKPLTERQKLANRLISKQRYRVEQTFGTLKRLFGMARASYFGTLKVNAQMVLKCLCLNLKKAANKISIELFPEGVVRPTTA